MYVSPGTSLAVGVHVTTVALGRPIVPLTSAFALSAWTTNDDAVATNCRALKAHGSGKLGATAYAQLSGEQPEDLPKVEDRQQPLYDPYKYYNYLIGQNSRLDSVQAADSRGNRVRLPPDHDPSRSDDDAASLAHAAITSSTPAPRKPRRVRIMTRAPAPWLRAARRPPWPRTAR